MWHLLKDKRPREKALIEATDSGGVVHKLRYWHNLFWTPDMGMYVYYQPVQWRYIEEE
jgi:hypothetical protein